MGRIQTNIGITSGIDYGSLVDQLMQVAGVSRDNLVERTDTLKQEQVAVTELTALLLSVQYATDNLGKTELFEEREATSSRSDLISASITGQPVEGSYRFTPLRTAQQHQLLSSGVKSNTDSLGGGSMTFRFGDHVERTTSLEVLNGGEGIDRGSIRITDRSGSSAEIDLSTVQTIDDVLDAINGSTQINVSAEVHGDGIRLVDRTGLEYSNLKVQEVGNGTTAESLGLAGIDAAENAAEGTDLIRLSRDLELDLLNDGNGVTRDPALPDLLYELRDGSTGTIDLQPINSGSSDVAEEKTLGDVIDRINAADPEKLRVEISEDGERLIVRDLTTGDGITSIESMVGSAAEELGIAGESTDGEISGRRLLGGLKSVLVSSLGGAEGWGELGALDLTDRTGATDTISLKGAETLEEVIEAINGAGVGITASVNAAKNGIQLTDTSGGLASNLIVSSVDSKETAEKLGIAVDDAADIHNGGDLHQKIVSHSTKLSDLNGGQGVRQGTIRITDSDGAGANLDIDSDIETVGDLIREINRLAPDVYAEINETGDGIWIRDTADGDGTLQVLDTNSTSAKDLHLTGGTVTKEIDGEEVEVVDGSTTFEIELDEDESLEDLIDRINDLGGGVQAMKFVDGSRNPYRLSLTSSATGAAGAMVVDMSSLGFELQETVAANDALMVLGELSSAAAGVLVSSSSNSFHGVIDGVELEVNEASTSSVSINITTSSVDVVANVQTLVDNFNRFRETLAYHSYYDPDTDEKRVLTGDASALRLETQTADFFSGRFFGAGAIQSLGEIGIDLNPDGTLSFDSAVLKQRFATDREVLVEFFTKEETGFSAKFKALAEQLTDQDSSLMTSRYLAIGQKIQQNEAKIEWMEEGLEQQRERMMIEFYRMELAITKLQSNMSFLDSISYIGTTTSSDE